MKDKRRILGMILLYSLSAIAAVGVGFAVHFALSGGGDVFKTVFFLALGVLVGFFFQVLFHEFGHLFAGLANGFRLESFQIGFLRLRRTDRLRLQFVTSKNYGGICQMSPVGNGDVVRRFGRFVCGGPIGSAVAAVVWLALAVLSAVLSFHPLLTVFFAAGIPTAVYLLVLNAYPFENGGVNTDGSYMFGLRNNTTETNLTVSILMAQELVMNGTRPGEIPEELIFADDSQANEMTRFLFANYRYAHALDKDDVGAAKEESKKMERARAFVEEVYGDDLDREQFYAEAVLFENKEKAARLYERIEKDLLEEETITSFRIQMCHALYLEGDVEKAERLGKLAISLKDAFPAKGIALLEERLVCKMQENIDAARGE